MGIRTVMRLGKALTRRAAAGAGALPAGALIASPASAAIHPADLIAPAVEWTGQIPSTVGWDQQGNVTLHFDVEGDGGHQGPIPESGPVEVRMVGDPGQPDFVVCTDPSLSFFGEGSCTIPA